MFLSYNFVYLTGSITSYFPSISGGTSMLAMSYGNIRLYTATSGGIVPIEKLRIDINNITAQNGAKFIGDLVGNITDNTSGSSSTFTGSLSGDIIDTMNATQIASSVIVNSDINASAAIVDTKLATISISGKVSNSATTATNNANPDTIILRDNNSVITIRNIYYGSINFRGFVNTSGNTYNSLYLSGGNNIRALFGVYTAFGDGVHLGYNNYYVNNSSTITIPSTAARTARISVKYG